MPRPAKRRPDAVSINRAYDKFEGVGDIFTKFGDIYRSWAGNDVITHTDQDPTKLLSGLYVPGSSASLICNILIFGESFLQATQTVQFWNAYEIFKSNTIVDSTIELKFTGDLPSQDIIECATKYINAAKEITLRLVKFTSTALLYYGPNCSALIEKKYVAGVVKSLMTYKASDVQAPSTLGSIKLNDLFEACIGNLEINFASSNIDKLKYMAKLVDISEEEDKTNSYVYTCVLGYTVWTKMARTVQNIMASKNNKYKKLINNEVLDRLTQTNALRVLNEFENALVQYLEIKVASSWHFNLKGLIWSTSGQPNEDSKLVDDCFLDATGQINHIARTASNLMADTNFQVHYPKISAAYREHLLCLNDQTQKSPKIIKKTVARRTKNLIIFTNQLKTEINYWFDSDFVGPPDPDEISPMDSDIVGPSDPDESSPVQPVRVNPRLRRSIIVDSEDGSSPMDSDIVNQDTSVYTSVLDEDWPSSDSEED